MFYSIFQASCFDSYDQLTRFLYFKVVCRDNQIELITFFLILFKCATHYCANFAETSLHDKREAEEMLH